MSKPSAGIINLHTGKKLMPKYPMYIVSKGRWETRLTSKALEKLNLPYHIIVEEEEYDNYASVIDKNKILVLPYKYLEEYDTCDDLGFSKSKGPGAARNYAWQHALDGGHKRHWVMDDNLDAFHRLNRNIKAISNSTAIFTAAEDFVDRYTNVPVSGLNYYSFCKSTDRVPAFTINTRIYSCLLIENDFELRWRGRYNEDTDLSLRVLKQGLCTIQFNAFLCGKITTQRMTGGNTKEFYKEEGTMAKSQMLEDLHPDVAKVVWKFNRWHHTVDYRPFKANKLIRRDDLVLKDEINNYGMKLL